MKNWSQTYQALKAELGKVIVGQEEVIQSLMISLISGGHAILQGVPGLAKTLIIHSLARTMGLSFNRIQFTPDMVPSDITGTEVLIERKDSSREFKFIEGPVFSNIVLADEINRTPPKTQSALLQAMQEREVSLLGKTYSLPDPFFVLATQNPIEYEGTYPLPEAQLDRFLMFIEVDYPDHDQEMAIIDADPLQSASITEVISVKELKKWMEQAAAQHVSKKVKEYVVQLVRSTRPAQTEYEFVGQYLEWGAGPRASQMIVQAARSLSFIKEKKMVDKDDIDEVLLPCLRHRLVPNYRAQSENVTVGALISEIKRKVEAKL